MKKKMKIVKATNVMDFTTQNICSHRLTFCWIKPNQECDNKIMLCKHGFIAVDKIKSTTKKQEKKTDETGEKWFYIAFDAQ